MSATQKLLKLEKALELMRRGSVLVHMHSAGKNLSWYVVPGGRVTDTVANKLLEHPAVSGSRDGLFPGLDQTYRLAIV